MILSLTGPALVGCGDNGSVPGTASESTGETTDADPTTGPDPDPTTGPLPTTGPDPTEGGSESEGESESESDSGESSTSTGEEPAVDCLALELTPELVDSGTWDETLTVAGFAGVDGLTPTVYDFARDADGAVLAVGYFRYLEQAVARSFARLEGDAWAPEASLDVELERPTISAVAADETGRVAIATYSALPADLSQREGEILLRDGGSFEVIGTFKGAVRTMTWFEGQLWVGGVFELDNEAVGPGLAIYGDAGWEDPPGGTLGGLGVFELTNLGDELLVGGSFNGVGGEPAKSVASWDGAAWTGFDLPNATVLALTRDAQGVLHAGGLFSVENSTKTGGVARWVDGAWESLGGGLSNPSFRGVVSDLVMFQDALHVAGCFTKAGGEANDPAAVPAAGGLARWTGDAWEALVETGGGVGSVWFSPLKCGDEGPAAVWEAEHQRLFVDGERLLLGGASAGVGDTASQSVIAYQGGEWVAQGPAGRGLSGPPRSLAVGGPQCAVHLMGGTTHASGAPVRGRVLRDEGDAWTPVSPPLPEEAYCWQLAVDAAGTPFVGCDLPPEGEMPAPGVVLRADEDAWAQVGETFTQGGVAAVGFDPTGTLWAAGGGGTGYVARFEGEAFTTLGTAGGRVSTLAFRPTAEGEPVQAVVGGYFAEFEGAPAGGVAHWNGRAWEPLGEGIAGTVLAVAYAPDGKIYASTADDGTPDRPILAQWDGAAWTDVATPEPGPVDAGYAFYSLLARGPYVVAAGFAWPGSDQRNLFVYDGEVFKSLGGGATAIYVESAALAKDGLWFGGTIAEAGPPEARISSVGVAHLE